MNFTPLESVYFRLHFLIFFYKFLKTGIYLYNCTAFIDLTPFTIHFFNHFFTDRAYLVTYLHRFFVSCNFIFRRIPLIMVPLL